MHGRKIILAVTGSIAAYKSATLVRALVKAGAEVRVLMTRAATDFISPLTLATLSKHDVVSSVHDGSAWNNHVELGLWADAMIVAPATATTLGKMANAICDSAVVAVYLSARCPVFFAPAMDLDMWAHPATRRNVELLRSYGNHLIDVGTGELASGLSGAGRMAEPEEIVATVTAFLARPPVQGEWTPPDPHRRRQPRSERGRSKGLATPGQVPAHQAQSLAGKTVLITAGPTYEDLDPVRYLGNRSTGRMGIALAEVAAQRGATVHLLLGPTHLTTDHPGITVHPIRSARELEAAVFALDLTQVDAAILAAAVADYRPATVAEQKIKKGEEPFRLELVRNPDIAARLGREKPAGMTLVGFALETENGEANARGKLERKKLDYIVLNSPNEAGAAFGHTTNKVSILSPAGITPFPLKPKTEVAGDILDVIFGTVESK